MIPIYGWNQYILALYYSVVTMVTVGYGDVTPKTSLELFFGIFSIFFACGMFAFSLNTIGSILTEIK